MDEARNGAVFDEQEECVDLEVELEFDEDDLSAGKLAYSSGEISGLSLLYGDIRGTGVRRSKEKKKHCGTIHNVIAQITLLAQRLLVDNFATSIRQQLREFRIFSRFGSRK